MKKYLSVVIIASFLILPSFASADVVSDIKAKINDLLSQVRVLQAQLESLEKKDTPDKKECLELRFRLYRGLNDFTTAGEVSKLQEFLKSEGDLNIALATGFFGEMTEAALKKWQAKNSIVISGSPETTGFGVVGPLTRLKIKEVHCGLLTLRSLKVLTPNGGETWQRGTIQGIQWQDPRWVGSTPESQSFSADNVNRYVDISLVPYEGPCTLGYSSDCSLQRSAISHYIAKDVLSRGLYNWTVGNVIDSLADTGSTITAPDGPYLIKICQARTVNCDSSDSYFKIGSTTSTNFPPVISGVSGPTILKIGETGTWTVKAFDPENGGLAYSVVWGDENVVSSDNGSNLKSSPVSQTATFTHTYSSSGTYSSVFTVTDNASQSAKTGISVAVGLTQAATGSARIKVLDGRIVCITTPCEFPLTNAKVTLYTSAGLVVGSTDTSSGSATFYNLFPGTYIAYASAFGFQNNKTTFTVTADTSIFTSITLQKVVVSELKVILPASGDRWVTGQTHKIAWTGIDNNSNVKITLSAYPFCADAIPPCSMPEIAPIVITYVAPNNGEYIWKVPDVLPGAFMGGTQITIFINGTPTTARSDTFLITNP